MILDQSIQKWNFLLTITMRNAVDDCICFLHYISIKMNLFLMNLCFSWWHIKGKRMASILSKHSKNVILVFAMCVCVFATMANEKKNIKYPGMSWWFDEKARLVVSQQFQIFLITAIMSAFEFHSTFLHEFASGLIKNILLWMAWHYILFFGTFSFEDMNLYQHIHPTCMVYDGSWVWVRGEKIELTD